MIDNIFYTIFYINALNFLKNLIDIIEDERDVLVLCAIDNS